MAAMITHSDHRPSILDSRLVAFLKQSEVWGKGPRLGTTGTADDREISERVIPFYKMHPGCSGFKWT